MTEVSQGEAELEKKDAMEGKATDVAPCGDASQEQSSKSPGVTEDVESKDATSGEKSPPAEHITSDADREEAANQSDSPKSRSSTGRAGSRRRQNSAKTAALLADPASLMELEHVDDITKKTQCSIPFRRSTFLLVGNEKQEPKTPTKSTWRYEVWNFMEKNNIASSPRPVTRRIPNFKEADSSCESLAELPQFKNAKTVVIGPDRPQQRIRYLALKEKKTLLVPTSRLASGLFNKIVPPENATDDQLALCATSEGVRTFSTPVGLDEEVSVDLVIMGCSVVTRTGRRLGKGEGFADLEWAMMMQTGAATADTTVITNVHDCQIKEEISDDLFQEYDLTVDVIVTPTQTLIIEKPLPKPKGIIWKKLWEQKLEKVPVLKELRTKEEAKGNDVTLGTREPKEESVSYVGADNEVDKSCQTVQGFRRGPRAYNATGAGSRFAGRRRTNEDPRRRHLRKRQNFQRERKREKSEANEDDDRIESEQKVSAGSGDATTSIVKRMRQRKNQRRQRSLRNRQNSKGGDNNENDTEAGDTSGKGEENSGAEDAKAASKGSRTRNRRSRRSERSQSDRYPSEMEAGDGRPTRNGRKFNNGYMPYSGRAPPPWFNQYNMPPMRFNNMYQGPPPPMRGGGGPRYGYRENGGEGYYGGPPGYFVGGGGRGGPGGRSGGGEFYPSNLKPAVFVGDLPEDCDEETIDEVLLDRKVRPNRQIWQKNERRIFLVFNTLGLAQECVRKLKNLHINDEACRVDLSNMTKRNYFY